MTALPALHLSTKADAKCRTERPSMADDWEKTQGGRNGPFNILGHMPALAASVVSLDFRPLIYTSLLGFLALPLLALFHPPEALAAKDPVRDSAASLKMPDSEPSYRETENLPERGADSRGEATINESSSNNNTVNNCNGNGSTTEWPRAADNEEAHTHQQLGGGLAARQEENFEVRRGTAVIGQQQPNQEQQRFSDSTTSQQGEREAEGEPETGREEIQERHERQDYGTPSEYSEEEDDLWEDVRSSEDEGVEEKEKDNDEELPLGCTHYRRKCKIVAPCCQRIYWCRHCHNEANEENQENAHEVDRHAVEEVVCATCGVRQPVYHCDECGICRSGGRESFFHCPTCGSCYPLQLRNKHKCLENAMKRQCPVCLEDMFSSLRQSQVLQCGHTLHADCLRLLQKQRGFQAIRCPMCSKSIADYSEFWKQLSEEIARTPIDEQFRRKVRIACNDCLERSVTDFHFLGLQCAKCNSFNTRSIAEE
ncbi:uncharacterized protein LOC34623526 [Cyclospora cayetanensis]|uniref:Uncharacterized protein LOC34623526 n=1 Tax=Cyclospora cayetanensis TaxID=88456 RepID=A0A6P6RS44_9EIME|nr:uncharacterized protein LOC34623526 [Cyclospora cayetanensis]